MGRWTKPIPADFLTITQVAARFVCATGTIQKLFDDCALIATHIDGRTLVHQDELARFIREQKVRVKNMTGKVYDRVGNVIPEQAAAESKVSDRQVAS